MLRPDHFILYCSDLERTSAHLENLLSVRPSIGGRHEVWGTYNRLLSLGDTVYLEILARDPEPSEAFLRLGDGDAAAAWRKSDFRFSLEEEEEEEEDGRRRYCRCWS